LVNVAAWKLDYVVVRDGSASKWADLVGKRINIPLQGGPVDFLAMYLIEKEGLKPSQFTFVYAPPVQAIQLLQLSQIDAAILPEPQVTMALNANPNARIAIDIQKDWAKWHRGEDSVPYVGLFINKTWADANPALARQIAQAYNQGVKWMNDNPQAAAALGNRALGVPEQVLLQGADRARLAIYDFAKTKALVDEHLTEMWQFSSELVGDKVPDAGFYRQ
jgi:NitT/TauT family transport system substrate-binding protein